MRAVRGTLALTAVLAAVLAPTAASAAGPADVCKHGQYVQYKDPTTGEAFKNQGKCIKFVKSGGTLEPAPGWEQAPPVVSVTELEGAEPGTFSALVYLFGLEPSTALTYELRDADGNSYGVAAGTTDLSGDFNLVVGGSCTPATPGLGIVSTVTITSGTFTDTQSVPHAACDTPL